MGGTWSENNPAPFPSNTRNATLFPANSGTVGNPIVYKACPGYPRPVIKGDYNGDWSNWGVVAYGKSNLVFDSLIVKYAYRGFYIRNSDSVLVQHCVACSTRGPVTDNSGGVMFGYTYDHSTGACEDQCWDNVVRACSLYYNGYNLGGGGDVTHSGIHAYCAKRSVFEDNYIEESVPNSCGIRLKYNNDSCTIRNNWFENCYDALQMSTGDENDSIYGNVFYNINNLGIFFFNQSNVPGPVDNVYVFNNTFYNVAKHAINVGYTSNDVITGLKIWNNLFVNCATRSGYQSAYVTNMNHTFDLWDYNCFWNSDGDASNIVNWKGTVYSLAGFRSALPYEDHGLTIAPEFVSTSEADFTLADSLSQVATRGRGYYESGYLPYMGAIPPGGRKVAGGNFVLGVPPIASGTFSGYPVSALTDGVIDPNGDAGTTWASDSSSSSAHWVELQFDQPHTVRSVVLYWANNIWTTESMISQQCRIQRFDGSNWVDVAVIHNEQKNCNQWNGSAFVMSPVMKSVDSACVTITLNDVSRTCAAFDAVEVEGLRIYQPAMQGPLTYPNILWLTEIEVYYDDKTPPRGEDECY